MATRSVIFGFALSLVLALVAGGCDKKSSGDRDAALTPDAASSDGGIPDGGDVDGDLPDAGNDPDGGTPCFRAPGPEDGIRRVVVSHPYGEGGAQTNAWEVLTLSTDGELSRPGVTFQMGRSNMGRVAFTPDGEIGLIAQDDGSLGVFALNGAGEVEVLHGALTGSFYATDVVMDPDGSGAWVLEGNWREHGGGIYRVDIGCEGQISDMGMVAPAKLPYGLVLLRDGSGRAVLAAKDVLASPEDQDAHLLAWGDPPSVLASQVAFSDDDDIIGSLAITPDGLCALVGDNQGVFSTPNRVATLALGASSLTLLQELSNIEDPIELVASPWNDTVLVVSGFGDAFVVLDYDPSNIAAPFSARGTFSYSGAAPQLPGKADMISRGTQKGLVLVSELSGVRRVRLEGGGVVTDLGVFALGGGYENMVGAVGVQP